MTDAMELLAEYVKTRVAFTDDAGIDWVVRATKSPDYWMLQPPHFEAVTSEAWVITAWNPRSHETPAAENAAANHALTAEISAKGYRFTPAVGSSPDAAWSEDSFLVHDPDPDWVKEAARRFGQNAVFRWTPSVWEVVWTAEAEPA
jgi:hypothetical protein